METIKIYTLSDSNGIKYIGKTTDIKKRLYRHIFDAKTKKKLNKRDAWIKSLIINGEEPIIEILSETNYDDWAFEEQYWISQFKAWGFNLKNMTDGGEGTFGRVVSTETKIKMSNSKKGKTPINLNDLKKSRIKSIMQYDLDGNFIKEWESISEAKKKLNINNINMVLKNKRNSAGGFIWRYKWDSLTPDVVNNIKIKHKKLEPKKILQMDKYDNIIKEWDSVSSVKSIYKHINSVLNGNRKTAGGYKWCYKIV